MSREQIERVLYGIAGASFFGGIAAASGCTGSETAGFALVGLSLGLLFDFVALLILFLFELLTP